MNRNKILIFLSILLFACMVYAGNSFADRWYYNYKINKVGMQAEGAVLRITNGTITVQKFLYSEIGLELLAVAIAANSNGKSVHAHYVSDCNCFDAVIISDPDQ